MIRLSCITIGSRGVAWGMLLGALGASCTSDPPAALDQIDLSPNAVGMGDPVDLKIDRGRRRVYVTDAAFSDPALVEIDIDRHEVARRLPTEALARVIGISPSGRRLFVTQTRRFGGAPVNYLVDVDTFTVLERFQESITDEIGDDEPVFRPDGQLIFVASGGTGIGDHAVDVYLHRE